MLFVGQIRGVGAEPQDVALVATAELRKARPGVLLHYRQDGAVHSGFGVV